MMPRIGRPILRLPEPARAARNAACPAEEQALRDEIRSLLAPRTWGPAPRPPYESWCASRASPLQACERCNVICRRYELRCNGDFRSSDAGRESKPHQMLVPYADHLGALVAVKMLPALQEEAKKRQATSTGGVHPQLTAVPVEAAGEAAANAAKRAANESRAIGGLDVDASTGSHPEIGWSLPPNFQRGDRMNFRSGDPRRRRASS